MLREPGGTSRRYLQTLFSVGVTAALTDGQLLERFASGRGEAAELAFAALVERHGPMVFRACRGILADEHDAHDAFQATFLVLLRKGRTLWVRDSLGPWLHRVACRAAVRARVLAQRRRMHERRAAAEEARGQQGADDTRERAMILHQEIDRLPERYRAPVVFCDLEGRSYEEAARHLGCPVGTVRSRLARGRERLRGRLTRRGLAPSAAGLTVALAPDAASAAAAAWVEGTTRWLRGIMAGGAGTAGEVPASVRAITEGVLKMISVGTRTVVAAGFLMAAGLAIGAGVLMAQQAEDKPGPPAGQALVADPERRWVATLPGGGTLELLGVSTYPAGPDTWWRPDGSPLAEAPCDSPPKNLSMEGNFVFRVLAARVSGLPADADRDWGVKEAGGSAEGKARKDGKELTGVSTVLVGVPRDRATCSVQFQAAAGPWKTVGTSYGNSEGVSNRNGPCYIFGEAIPGKKGTILTVSHDISGVAVRVVAVDREGREQPNVGHSGAGVKDFYQIGAEFDLGPEAIKEYRLQTRSYERVELPGIALRPRGPR